MPDMFALFNRHSKKKPEPRFIDIEGFDVMRKRHAMRYAASPAALSSMVTGGVICTAMPLLLGYAGWPLLAGTLMMMLLGTGLAIYDQRRILKPLKTLDSTAIDREGRHPSLQEDTLKKLWCELGDYKLSSRLTLGQLSLAMGLSTTISIYAITQDVPEVSTVFALAAGMHVPIITTSVCSLIRARRLSTKKYTFCMPPALSAERVVEVDNAVVSAARISALKP